MKVSDVLLFPLAILYKSVTGIRNHLYNIGHKKSTGFQIPVISVGNLNIGGSGKTPAIEYLIKLLMGKYEIATLSRGYGRKTKGLRFANESDSAQTLGDEPFQFFRNFGKAVHIVVAEDRAFAIPHILHQYPGCNVVLLDDAFQHRSVNPMLSILLTDFTKPFYKDYLLPLGRLRETRSEASRADIIIVTKCNPNLTIDHEEVIRKEISRYAKGVPVFFSGVTYGAPVTFGAGNGISENVVLVSGIAKPQPLEDYVQANFNLIKHFKFRDHHNYTVKNVQQITRELELHNDVSLLTTEKDMVRLLDANLAPFLKPYACFYLPIEMTLLKNGAEFDNMVLNAIEKQLVHSQTIQE